MTKSKKEKLTSEGREYLEAEFGGSIKDVRDSGFAPSWATQQDTIHMLNRIGKATDDTEIVDVFFEGMRWQKKKSKRGVKP